MLITLEYTRLISCSELKERDVTIVSDAKGRLVIDEKLKVYLPHRGCHGLHFLTERGAVVCYEPVASVRILK